MRGGSPPGRGGFGRGGSGFGGPPGGFMRPRYLYSRLQEYMYTYLFFIPKNF